MTDTPPSEDRSELSPPHKVCMVCHIDKPLSELYQDEQRSTGYENRCKPCNRASSNRSYRNTRFKTILPTQRIYKHSEAGRATTMRAARAAYLKYPDKWIARSRLRYAVKKGTIKKPEQCEADGCPSTRIEAHHYLGYSKEHWYDVHWYCRRHHWDAHKFSLESRGLV